MNKEKTKERWEGFNAGTYNEPPDGWVEIDKDNFASAFFQYITDKIDFRQLYLSPDKKGVSNAKLFWLYDEPLGVAMVRTEEGLKYYKFGIKESWIQFTNEFCNQFSGDNS